MSVKTALLISKVKNFIRDLKDSTDANGHIEPLALKKIIIKRFPEVKERVEKIDFENDDPDVLSQSLTELLPEQVKDFVNLILSEVS